jgi:hypothetical protein
MAARFFHDKTRLVHSMSTAQELLRANRITLDSYAPGRYYTLCPKCSKERTKPGHKSAECLGVTIDASGARWGCNHCSWTGPEKGAAGAGSRKREDLTSYVYRDRDGVVRFRKMRNRPGAEPRFWLEHPDGMGGWKKGTKDVDTKILYRIDEVAKAIAAGQMIAIVEGEKDADNLWRIGIAATCNAHGASEAGKRPKWDAGHTTQLDGANLVVFNDNDAAGIAHAEAICGSLAIQRGNFDFRRLDLKNDWPEIPKSGDVSDWLAAGGDHTPERLLELIERAPLFEAPQPEPEPKSEPKPDPTADDAELERLAALSPVQYEQERKAAAERLGMRASVLDKVVAKLRPDDESKQGRAISFPEPEPWPEPVDGADLLTGIADAIRNHVVMSDAARDTAALWALHTHLPDRSLVSPRLAITSPTKRCGKTTLLDVAGRLVLRPLPTAHVTPAAIFRTIEAYRPTLLIDEADTFLRDNDELRGIINSGHRKGGSVLRTVGDDHEPRAFATYAACAIALIGRLPETLHDRAVGVALERRLPSETITPFRPDRAGHLDELARQAARFVKDNAERIGEADPEMPDGIINREADNWRPLLAIADIAGGDWPKRARDALKTAHTAEDDESRLAMLLADIKRAFEDEDTDRLPSSRLVAILVAIEGRPWAEYRRGKAMTQNQLARALKPLGIAPEVIRHGDSTPRGYMIGQFAEAFERYLSLDGAFKPPQRNNVDEMGTSGLFQSATRENDVADRKCEKPNNDGLSGGVAVWKGEISVCAHCGEPSQPDNEVTERWIDGEQALLHWTCVEPWMAELPPRGSKVLGLAPGERCVRCGSGRDVWLIQLPDEDEALPRHKSCAARYWTKHTDDLSGLIG